MDSTQSMTEFRGDAQLRAALDTLLALGGPRDFAVRLGMDTLLEPSPGQPHHFTLVFKDAQAASRTLRLRDVRALGQAYVEGDLDVEGNMEAAIGCIERLLVQSRGALQDGSARLPPRELAASRERTREAVNYHYDLPLEFWRLWLDDKLLYTCAYFSSPDESLESAQVRKLDHICRKLLLRPGDRLLDLGCGWGALSVYSAKHYGAEVLGTTLSELQAARARQLAVEHGVSDRCHIEVQDFRDLDGPGRFDKIAAVGVIEHVGESFQQDFFQAVSSLLRQGGLFLNQGIVCSPVANFRGHGEFIQEFIFPEAGLSSLGTMLSNAESSGFDIRDVESLSDHYLYTLRHWLNRLERNAERVEQLVGARRYRAFRAYLAGFAREFQRSGLRVYQTLLLKQGVAPSGLPLTREHLRPEDSRF
jgi:cyclopropane-fatty-acyl-phospholipid synthase